MRSRSSLRMILLGLSVSLFFAPSALGQAPAAPSVRPLKEILRIVDSTKIKDVLDGAEKQAADQVFMGKRGPAYKSVPLKLNKENNAEVTDDVIFEGCFIPASNDTKMVIFSDDGCDVFVNDEKILNASSFKRPQHLPDLKEKSVSFHELTSVKWEKDKLFHVRVHYSNTIYLGDGDIDGCTLFAYNGGGTVATVEIVDANNKNAVIKEKQVTVVGKKISLKGRITPKPGKDDKVTQLWTIEDVQNKTIKNYEPTETKAKPVPLEKADLEAAEINFYWIDGGDPLKVKFTMTINERKCETTVEFVVKRPEAVFTSKTTVDNLKGKDADGKEIDTGGIGIGFNGLVRVRSLFFGTDNSRGIRWTAEVTAPAESGGKIAFVQVVKTERKVTVNNGKSFVLSSEGEFVLDRDFPYGLDSPERVKNVNAGMKMDITNSDTPHENLSNALIFKSVNDEFQTYLIFKPAGKASEVIWVTLKRTEWFWKGSAVRKAKDSWFFAKTPPPSAAKDPTSENSIKLPDWDKNVIQLKPKPLN